MNRPVDHARRAELLDRIVDHALSTGATRFTLRPAAAAAGTSARMLVHHFGSGEALAEEVALRIEARLVEAFGLPQGAAPAELIRRMWSATERPEVEPLVRAVFEIWGAALVDAQRRAGFLSRIFAPWRDGLAAALREAGVHEPEAGARATLLVAGFNGLQLARLTTGDNEATTAALDLLIAQILENGAPR